MAMSDGAGVLGVRGAEEICCHESNIKKDTPKTAPEPESSCVCAHMCGCGDFCAMGCTEIFKNVCAGACMRPS